jgi:hypothetical protein
MAACGLTGRGAQTRMRELTGWSAATMSGLYNGTQDYSPQLIEEAAKALNLEDFELLMPPDRAMNLRQIQKSAETIVEIAHREPPAPPPADAPAPTRRRA